MDNASQQTGITRKLKRVLQLKSDCAGNLNIAAFEYNESKASEHEMKLSIIQTMNQKKFVSDRYVVKLPWKNIREHSNNHKAIAEKRSSREMGLTSLNEHLSPIDNVVANLTTILLSFRLNKVAITENVERALLQIAIAEEDCDSHRTSNMLGGFWERPVRDVKKRFEAAIGKLKFSLDDLTTVLAEIESIRSRNEYLCQLRSTPHNRNGSSKNVKDVVLLHEDSQPRLLWRLGVVKPTYQVRDGLMRACDVELQNQQVLKRPNDLITSVRLSVYILFDLFDLTKRQQLA
uniref:DUF5641 domain-containing protein n=1 Tax=Glossina austeni TaxID=7395 RepID=A0A1A9V2X8_GLOAU